MTSRALLLSLIALSAIACDPPNECIARGGVSTFAGSASYEGQVTRGGTLTTLAGATDMALVVNDYAPDCTYDSMTFTISVGSCVVEAVAGGSATTKDGDAVSAAGTLVAGQSCDLTLATGTAHVEVVRGYFTDDGDGNAYAYLSFNVLGYGGESVSSGNLDLELTGQ